MLHEISGNRVQSGLGRQNMDFLCKFPFQLFLLADIQICRFDGIHDLLRDFRILDGAKLFAAILIVQRNRCAVLYGALKVIDGNIAAESAFRDGIVGEQGRAGETDPGRGRQQGHHIFRENTILAAVGFVGHDDNVIVRRNWRQALLIEFLNQREDEAGIAFQLMDEILTALGYVLGCFHVAQHSAVFKGIADLCVQLLPVGEHHESGRAVKFPADLLGQEQHGIALAASLGVPEYAQLAVSELALPVNLHCFVDAEILVVPGQNFGSVPAGVVKQNEILKQIHEIALVANAPQHGFQGNRTFFVLLQPLPLMEEGILAAQSTDLGFLPVGQDQESVVIKQVGDGVQIVGVIAGVGILHIHIEILQLHEQQGDAVDKAHDIRPAAVQFAVDLQFLDGQKVVVQRVIKVKYPHTPGFLFSIGLLDRNRNAIPEIAVLLLIDLDQGGRGQVIFQLLHRVLIEGFRQPGIQLHHSPPEVTPEHDFPIAFPTKGAVFAQLLRVVGIGNVPAPLVTKQIPCTVLD